MGPRNGDMCAEALAEGYKTEDDLRREAAYHFGACDDGSLHPDDADWEYVATFPVASLLTIMDCDAWKEWFEQELADEGEERGWHLLLHEEIEQAVVLSMEDGKVQIWDGWHRCGATVTNGAETIKAIVGTRKVPVPTP